MDAQSGERLHIGFRGMCVTKKRGGGEVKDQKPQDQAAHALVDGAVPSSRSLAAVLLPSHPPVPTNVRVLRRFGIQDQKKIRRLERSMLFGGRQDDPATRRLRKRG
jgi:hypothetical protein